ncbi:hypothetical protein BX265_5593 [Streptomyces sp. TLI_235]|nr:hypothetical protein [Streptomyces sp. TLI_235]PBC71026.1 hypothetical protein BX265_5593 [Streptomyces sp. TLI_235]
MDAIGGEWLTAAHVNADQGRWLVLLGVVGVLAVAGAAGTSGLAEFVRNGRALGRLGVLTGSRSIHLATAVIGVFLPIAAAGAVGGAAGVWMALPAASAGASALLDRALPLCAAAVAVLAAGLAAWGGAVAAREADRWRPTGD